MPNRSDLDSEPQSPQPAAVGQPAADPGGASAHRRVGLRANAADMVRSMVVVLAIVALIVLFVPRPTSVPMASVDVRAAASDAQSQFGFELAAVVPDGWRVTSTRVRRDTGGLLTWTVNYLTPQGRYAAVSQAGGYSSQWLSALNQGGRSRGTVVIDGQSWQSFDKAERSIYSLLNQVPGRSTLVLAKNGGSTDARLLAQSLWPAR